LTDSDCIDLARGTLDPSHAASAKGIVSRVPEMHDPILAPGFHPMTNVMPRVGERAAKTAAENRLRAPCRFGLIDRTGCRASDWQERKTDKGELHRSNVPQKRRSFHS
jgi:hypothetical protein